MIDVVNRQRKKKITVNGWSARASEMLRVIGSHGSATIAFVSDDHIRRLNKRFRGIDRPTDVLSFPSGEDDNSGDIAISLERAAIQSQAHGLTFEDEIAQLILHGLLHLCGYDHETDDGEMNRMELRLRRNLGI
ncbi:MAG: rRNA maturation RNase YbeY [Pyrinomonadaceae bacterium]